MGGIYKRNIIPNRDSYMMTLPKNWVEWLEEKCGKPAEEITLKVIDEGGKLVIIPEFPEVGGDESDTE